MNLIIMLNQLEKIMCFTIVKYRAKAPEKVTVMIIPQFYWGTIEEHKEFMHEVNITVDNGGQLYWNNSAGWTLNIIDGVLYSGEDCPYCSRNKRI